MLHFQKLNLDHNFMPPKTTMKWPTFARAFACKQPKPTAPTRFPTVRPCALFSLRSGLAVFPGPACPVPPPASTPRAEHLRRTPSPPQQQHQRRNEDSEPSSGKRGKSRFPQADLLRLSLRQSAPAVHGLWEHLLEPRVCIVILE